MPVPGHAAGLVTAEGSVADGGEAEVASREVHWVGGSGPGRERIQLNRSTLHTSRVFGELNLGHVCGRVCGMWVILFVLLADCKRRRYDQQDEGMFLSDHTRRRCDEAYEGSTLAQNRTGVG